MQVTMRDCQAGPGRFTCGIIGSNTNLCVNNLFERTAIWFTDVGGGNGPLVFFNNLVRYGSVKFDKYDSTYSWLARDNLFDSTTNTLNLFVSGFSQDHNAYLYTAQMTPTNVSDVVLTSFTYTNGPLGTFYHFSTNLVDAGSATADLRALYHFTTQSSQVKETNSVVDIGYHYVAVNSSGNPIDTDGDNVPDYLEDANGNGAVDSGEPDWMNQNDPGLLGIWISRPANSEPLP
jgi:hypothetical protein